MKIKLFTFGIFLFFLLNIQVLAVMIGPHFSLEGGLTYSGGATSSSNRSLHIIQEYHEAGIQTSNSFSVVPGFRGLFQIARLGPIIVSIDPASGYNIAPIHINKISGANFAAKPIVKLTMSGETDLIAANVMATGSTQISCDFNLAGANTGAWNVIVANSSTESSTLPNGFEVKSYSYELSTAINTPNPFDPAKEPTTIMYKLAKDTDVTVVIFSATGSLLWKRDYPAGTNGGKAGENTVIWNGISDFSEMASNGVYLLRVLDRSSRQKLTGGNIAVIRR